MEAKKEILERFTYNKFSMKDYLAVKNFVEKEEFAESLDNFMEADWQQTENGGRNLQHILSRLHQKIKQASSPELTLMQKIYRSFSKVAAILFIPALITIAFFTYDSITQEQVKESWVEIHSPAGARTNFQLPDGSTGWLNSESSIKYQAQFRKERLVEISGEVWFDVVHKNNQEFKVITPHFDVKVLGTQFNVTAYNDEPTAQVILDEGKVQVLGKDQFIKTTLVPNQRLIYNKSAQKFIKTEFDSKSYSSWKDGILIFKNVPFSEIARRLGRKYNAEIIVKEKDLNEAIFRATFEDEGLNEICKLLTRVAPIEYKIHKRDKKADGSFSKNKVEIWEKR